MTRPSDTHRPGDHSLSLIRDNPRRAPGTSLEPRRRGDVEPAQPADAAMGAADVLRVQLRERTADLQRMKSEYDNYRKRVSRDRRTVGEIAVANVLTGLIPVLDAIDQAREQGEVTGGFQRVTEALEAELAGLGLQSFGTAGDPFDPACHEAVSCTRSNDVEQPTCTTILRPGYRVGDHLLRPAQAEVAEPPEVGDGGARGDRERIGGDDLPQGVAPQEFAHRGMAALSSRCGDHEPSDQHEPDPVGRGPENGQSDAHMPGVSYLSE
jgi:molecular chaperone GrpE